MKIKTVAGILKQNNLVPEEYGLGAIHPGGFGYFYRDGLSVTTYFGSEELPFVSTKFGGSETEFLKEWLFDVYTHVVTNEGKGSRNALLFKMLFYMQGYDEEVRNTLIALNPQMERYSLHIIDSLKDIRCKCQTINFGYLNKEWVVGLTYCENEQAEVNYRQFGSTSFWEMINHMREMDIP